MSYALRLMTSGTKMPLESVIVLSQNRRSSYKFYRILQSPEDTDNISVGGRIVELRNKTSCACPFT